MPVKFWITNILTIVQSGSTGIRPIDAADVIIDNNITLIESTTIIFISVLIYELELVLFLNYTLYYRIHIVIGLKAAAMNGTAATGI
jgi:hypothetical protein